MSWDDAAVDWAAADLVAVRATWDYHRRCPDFLAWARKVDGATTLLNGADVFAWNADKAYLAAIADRVPVVPTLLVDDSDLRGGLAAALERFGPVVVKARTGAGGVGVVQAECTDDYRLSGLTAGPWVVQPLVESVRTRGETSVFVLGGVAVSQVDKLPGGDEIRVHEQFGGVSRPVPLGGRARRGGGRGDGGGVGPARYVAGLRPGRPDGARRPPGRQRARADRAGAVPRRAAGQRGAVRGDGGGASFTGYPVELMLPA